MTVLARHTMIQSLLYVNHSGCQVEVKQKERTFGAQLQAATVAQGRHDIHWDPGGNSGDGTEGLSQDVF